MEKVFYFCTPKTDSRFKGEEKETVLLNQKNQALVYRTRVFSRELPERKNKIILVVDLQSLRIKAYLCTRKKQQAFRIRDRKKEGWFKAVG